MNAVERVLLRYSFCGYRREQVQLVRQGLVANEQRVRNVLTWLDMTCHIGQIRLRSTDSKHPHRRFHNVIRGITPTSNEVAADMTYIRLGMRFIYRRGAGRLQPCGLQLVRRPHIDSGRYAGGYPNNTRQRYAYDLSFRGLR